MLKVMSIRTYMNHPVLPGYVCSVAVFDACSVTGILCAVRVL